MSLAHDFEKLALDIQSNLNTQGVKVKALSPVRRFNLLEEAQQKQIIKKLMSEKEQMELLREDLTEIDKLEKICQYHGFYLKDETVARLLDKEIPWEIMDFNFQQLFRSKKILDLSNYSIEDFETLNSVELFKRPDYVLQKIISTVELLKTRPTIIFMDDFAKYVIQENYTKEKEKMEIQHQFIAPLFCQDTQACKAILSVFKIKKIEESQQDSLVVFSH